MLESLLFLGLSISGLIGAFAALTYLIYGLFKKDHSSTRTGLLLLLLPGLCFGLIYWWYEIHNPAYDQQLQVEYSGTYTALLPAFLTEPDDSLGLNCYQLTLFSDGTFELDNTPGLSYWGTGTWETGYIDGQFVFYDLKERMIATGMPSGNQITIDQVTFHGSSPCK